MARQRARATARGGVGHPPAHRAHGAGCGCCAVGGGRTDADHAQQPAGQPVHAGYFGGGQLWRRARTGLRRSPVPHGGWVCGAAECLCDGDAVGRVDPPAEHETRRDHRDHRAAGHCAGVHFQCTAGAGAVFRHRASRGGRGVLDHGQPDQGHLAEAGCDLPGSRGHAAPFCAQQLGTDSPAPGR
ncbi:hypothetical protein D3C71_1562640 [compost metagenome]